jgi:hypothetical protein
MSALPRRYFDDDVLTRAQLAERLQCDLAVTYRWPDCPRLRVGRECRFVWGEVLEWLRARDVSTSSSTSRRRGGGGSSTGHGQVFRMPHRAGGSGDAEGRDPVTMRLAEGGSGVLPEGHDAA